MGAQLKVWLFVAAVLSMVPAVRAQGGIDFPTQPGVADQVYSNKAMGLSARAQGGGAVTFQANGPSHCSVEGNRMHVDGGVGACTVCAVAGAAAGNSGGERACHSFTVKPAPLLVTAFSPVVHQGDRMPPLTVWEATGWVGKDTTFSASKGRPRLRSAMTGTRSIGSAPITIEAGTFAAPNYQVTFANGTARVIAQDAWHTGARPHRFAYPADALQKDVKKDYGAKGDGVTDDTAALVAALSDGRSHMTDGRCDQDFYRSPKMIYFPPGRYRITDTLTWPCGAEMSLRGAGDGQTVIVLDDRLPAFNNPKDDGRAMLWFKAANFRTPHGGGYGNISFRNYLSGIDFDTGVGNANATGLRFTASNSGGASDAQIVSESTEGFAGLQLSDAWDGPELNEDMAIYGFRFGVDLGRQAQYIATNLHLQLEGQTGTGILGSGLTIATMGMFSCNAVPAAMANGSDFALIHAMLACGGAKESAITVGKGGLLHLREVEASGYAATVADGSRGGAPLAVTGRLANYHTGQAVAAFPVANGGDLNLPIEEMPEVADPDPSTWIRLSEKDPARWNAQMATCRSSTAYLPAGQYVIPDGDYTVASPPACIHHIHLFDAGFSGPRAQVHLTVAGQASDPPLLIESTGTNFNIAHTGGRRLLLRHTTGGFSTQPGAGDEIAEDFGGNTQYQAGQHVWVYAHDAEIATVPAAGGWPRCPAIPSATCVPPSGEKTTLNGAQVWILGAKTEKGSTNFVLANGARLEIYGAFFLTLQVNQQPNSTLFRTENSSMSADFRELNYNGCMVAKHNCGTAHILIDTQNGVTRTVDPPDQNSSYQTGLLYSAGAGAKTTGAAASRRR